jgi:hypothetical protein
VNSEDEALAAIERITAIERRGIRAVIEQRFTATMMARAYLNVYAQLLNRRPLRRAS